MVKKIAFASVAAMLVATMVFAAYARPAYAADKVDCNAVMNELNNGKHPKEVAKDLSISTSSVYRCKRHAEAASKAKTKTSLQTRNGRDKTVRPTAVGSPGAAASPATTR